MSNSDPQQPFPNGSVSPYNEQPQYGRPQYAQPQYSQTTEQPAPVYPTPAGRMNILGILALALLVLQTILGTFTPLLYRLVIDNFAILTTGITVANVLMLLAALGLAIGGLYQRGAVRFRWAAIGSAVAAGLGLVGTLLNIIGGWVASALYW